MKLDNLTQELEGLIDVELMNKLVQSYLMSSFGYTEAEAVEFSQKLEYKNKEAMKNALAECVAQNAVLIY